MLFNNHDFVADIDTFGRFKNRLNIKKRNGSVRARL